MDNENQNEMPHGFETWCQFLKKAMEDCPDEVNKPNGKIRMQYLSPNDGEITEIFDVIDVKAMAMDEVMKIMPLEKNKLSAQS